MIRNVIAIATICALGAASAWAGVGVWSGQGPYGGYIYDIQQDPLAPATLYTTTRSGIFKSADSGGSWAPGMNGIVGSVSYGYPLMLDAHTSGVLYTADSTGHLYRTSDGAANWLQTGYVLPPVATISQINQITDSGSSGTLYLATAPSGILVSTDSGATFSALNGSGGSALPASIPFQVIAVDPSDSNKLLTGTAAYDVGPGPNVPSIFRSTDGGAHWSGVYIYPAAAEGGYYNPGDPSCSMPNPPPYICEQETSYITVSQISFGHGSEVYAVSDAGVLRSTDGGASWLPIGNQPTGLTTTVNGDASTANSVYLGGWYGLKHSADGGSTFSDVTTSGHGFSPNGTDVATAQRLLRNGTTWYLASQEAGLFVSTNSGVDWSGANNGIEATNIRALGMVPVTSQPPRILAGYGDAFRPSPGVYAGSDAGDGDMSWTNFNSGLRAYQIRAITVDPTTATGNPATTVVYAGGRSESNNSIAPRNGGIYKCCDGSGNWVTIDNGIPLRYVNPSLTLPPFIGTIRSIVLDPNSCSGGPPCSTALNTVYATSNGCHVSSSGASSGYCYGLLAAGTDRFRVLKSINGGALWSTSDTGIPQSIVGTGPDYFDGETLLVVPLVIDPTSPNILYAGTSDTFDPNYVNTPTHPPTLATGIYKSTDFGATWAPINTGLPTYPSSSTILGVLTLAIDPNHPNTLWASAIDTNTTTSAPGHIYKTTNGGASWSDSSTGMTSADIRALLVDPTDPANPIVYAAGGGTSGNPGGVFKSYDGGATWHSISIGLPADAALSLALDPTNHNKLYAGTSSGVWEITETMDTDMDGVSDIQENMGPNGGDSNNDGIPDYKQADVTYVPAHQSAAAPTKKAPLAPVSGNNDFAVQVAAQGSSCTQTQDVQSKSASANGPDPIATNLDFVYGVDLLQFEILNCAGTIVTVTYPNFSFGAGWTFRFYGPATPGDDSSIGWYDFSPTDHASQYAVQLDAHSWQLKLTRGAFGSYRPASTHSILFQGGPGYSDRVFAGKFD